ncbi:MAG TPA: heterodisulfide reductase-related iron-sulfur binding cluster [candidate division Zixibacteria bacterium]|nr:heterodisulfide reductase-related iron-sulfur binding cluster [candidate division Zixibacteria bacterium]
MKLDTEKPEFWESAKLEAELRRVFDVCNGCRRCYNLCPSFNDLFQRLDREDVDGDAEKLGGADFQSVTDLCYQCKLCFNHCPYTPPHRWDLDFPRLMLRSRAIQTRRSGRLLQDRFLGDVDRIGRIGSRLAPLVNWLNRNPVHRWLLEKTVGIHRDRILPRYARQTFRQWYEKRETTSPAGGGKKAALFYTCTVNFNQPSVGRAAIRVLEKNGVQTGCPEQRCCGMPFLDGGDLESAKKSAAANVSSLHDWVRRGFDIVVLAPTCSYVLKREYPELLQTEAAKEVAAKALDVCEYLMALHAEGRLDTGFVRSAGKIAYQMPCHLRAQNIGYKSRDLMQLIPGTSVRTIERCAAIDGTWGLKRQYFELSLKVARPLLDELAVEKPDRIVSDCALAGLQIEQGCGKKPLHPVEVVAIAYGLSEEGDT